MSSTDLLASLSERLSPAEGETLRDVLRLAERQSLTLYLVGGSVRDLLLGRGQVDLDVAVEGDALALARSLAEETGAKVTVHDAFGTATVKGDDFGLDLARTRAESYPHPGVLPVVRPASLREDLARRDFTINAMALRLTQPDPGTLVDPHAGHQDLERRLIRVLHDGSFQDDATRMLRATRYMSRLSFELEEGTRRLLQRDLDYLKTVGGARVRNELMAMLYEEQPEAVLHRGEDLGLLGAVHWSLVFDAEAAVALERARQEHPAPWDEFCLCLLTWHSEETTVSSIVERLALSRRHERALQDAVRLRTLLPAIERREMAVSEIVEMLEPVSAASLWALALREPETVPGQRALSFLREWRHVRPILGGRALKRLGVPEGPQLGALLRMLRAARLDGRTETREDETALVEKARRAEDA